MEDSRLVIRGLPPLHSTLMDKSGKIYSRKYSQEEWDNMHHHFWSWDDETSATINDKEYDKWKKAFDIEPWDCSKEEFEDRMMVLKI